MTGLFLIPDLVYLLSFLILFSIYVLLVNPAAACHYQIIFLNPTDAWDLIPLMS
jgi:hypothetical protein